jgi:hypothetical protein
VKDSTVITLAAVGGITAIEICAMAFLGIDGVLLGATVGTLAGLAGYRIGKPTPTYHNDEVLKNGQRDS